MVWFWCLKKHLSLENKCLLYAVVFILYANFNGFKPQNHPYRTGWHLPPAWRAPPLHGGRCPPWCRWPPHRIPGPNRPAAGQSWVPARRSPLGILTGHRAEHRAEGERMGLRDWHSYTAHAITSLITPQCKRDKQWCMLNVTVWCDPWIFSISSRKMVRIRVDITLMRRHIAWRKAHFWGVGELRRDLLRETGTSCLAYFSWGVNLMRRNCINPNEC